jgi:hypothetical protein
MRLLIDLPFARRLAPACVFALGIALLIPAAACAAAPNADAGSEADASEENPADLVAMLPSLATTIGFIDFAAIRETAAYEFLKQDAGFGDTAALEKIVEETGIDLRTDLHRIAFISNDGFGTWDERGAFLVLATFERARIEEAIASAPTDQYSDRNLYQIGAMDRDEENEGEVEGEDDSISIDVEVDGWMTILSDTVLAFGSSDLIRAIVDVADGAPSVRENSTLMVLLEDVNTDAQIWLVSAREGLFSSITPDAGSPIGQIGYDRINAMMLALDLSDGLSFRMRGRTPAEEDAKNLGDALNGMVALGKMMLQNSNPDVFEILDRDIETGSRGRDVTIEAHLTIDDLRVLRDYAETVIGSDRGDKGQIGD